MKKYIYILLTGLVVSNSACDNDKFLDKEPTNLLLNDQVWKDKTLITSVLGNLYGRFPDLQSTENWWDYTNFDEAFASAAGDYGRHRNTEYGYGDWGIWDYGYIREINVFIQRCQAATEISDADKAQFLAE